MGVGLGVGVGGKNSCGLAYALQTKWAVPLLFTHADIDSSSLPLQYYY